VIFETGENIYFSTYPPPTLIHLAHRFTSASKPAAYESFGCCLSHFRTSVSTYSSSVKGLPPNCGPLYATNTSQRKQKTFLYKYPLRYVLLPTKNAQQNAALRQDTPQTRSPFRLLKPASATQTVMTLDCAPTK
jgi:hypothetical protein